MMLPSGCENGGGMWIELVGRLRLVTDDGTVVDADAFPGRQGRAVFAYLAAHHGPVPREELGGILWPDRLPRSWGRDLSVIVSRLRALLRSSGVGSALLAGTAGAYELRLPPGTVVDLDLIPEDLARGQAAFARGDADTAGAAAAAAAERARRPLLPGFDVAWVDAKRSELRSLLIDSLDLAARARSHLGDTADAVRYAREAVGLQPLRERGYVTLMRVHLAGGDRAQALRTYEECRMLLADELGVDPSAETQAVYLEALRADGTVGSVGGVDERVVAELPGDAPVMPGNLPLAVDSLWGRDTDLFALGRLVRRRRIVTLVGVGGVGKSRLAVECGRRMATGYRDGAWLCELSVLRSGDAVGHAVATSLAVTPAPGGDTISSLAEALRARSLLVVLDNCDHLLAEVRPLVETLSVRCASVHILATSREPLAVPGEHVWRVQPLALPFPGSPSTSASHRTSALQLFADRARAVDPDFALTDATTPAVADICRRLDGLPLAIELAARRVGVLSPAEIADRLRDPLRLLVSQRPVDVERQRDLRRTIAWSYDLLEDAEQRAFECLAVFAGDFDLAAAAVVGGLTEEDALDVTDSLVNRSMVVARPGTPSRYGVYETLRQFAHERLEARGSTEIASERHAGYYVALAEGAEPRLRSADEARAVTTLDRELANLRRAHGWAREHDLHGALRMSAALHWYTFFRHRYELYGWARQAVEAPGAAELPGFAVAAASAANGAWVSGQRGWATALAEQALASLASDDPDRRFAAHALGDVALFEGRLEEAFSWYAEALAFCRTADDAFHAGIMLGNHALIRGYQGDVDEALRLADAGHREARASGSPTCEAWNHYAAGEALSARDPRRAIEALEASMAAARRVQNRFMLGVALVTLTSLRGRHGDPDRALLSFLDVIAHWHEAGNWTQQWTALRNLVQLLLRLERYEPGAELLAAIREASTSAPAFGTDEQRLQDAEHEIHVSLAPERLEAAVARGAAMRDDEAVRFARRAILDALASRASG
jgi:predicted ATPase/DNA-binding SARP family transcriptional activator